MFFDDVYGVCYDDKKSYRRRKHKNIVPQAKKYIKYFLELLRAISPIYINGFRSYLMYMVLVYIRYSAQFTF